MDEPVCKEIEVAVSKNLLFNEKIKNKARDELKFDREVNRKIKTDSLRVGLADLQGKIKNNENITEKDIIGLAGRIKRRKKAESDDLYRLSIGFLQTELNIRTFVNIQGALNVIVKVLTGSNAKLQILAAECINNLSLGDSITCEKIAIACGTYLTAFSNHPNKRLVELSLWTILNLVQSKAKPIAVLLSQGITSKLTSLIQNKLVDSKLINECFKILTVIVVYGQDLLTQIDKEMIMGLFSNSEGFILAAKMTLLYEMLSSSNFIMNQANVKRFIQYCCSSIYICIKFAVLNESDLLLVVLAIRILSNIIAKNEESIRNFIEFCATKNIKVSEFLNSLIALNNKVLTKEVLWFAGNLVQSQNRDAKNYFTRDNLKKNLKVQKKCSL